MKKCRITLSGLALSAYSPSKVVMTPTLDREQPDDYDARTWRDHCTVNSEGYVCQPAMAYKMMFDTSSKKIGMKVPGRKGAGYAGFFTSGLFCNGDVPLLLDGKPIKKTELTEAKHMQMFHVSPKGLRGGSSRVWKRYPMLFGWKGVAELIIVDDLLTPEIVDHHAKAGGIIVGLGRFRPENGGTNGRFHVDKFEVEELTVA